MGLSAGCPGILGLIGAVVGLRGIGLGLRGLCLDTPPYPNCASLELSSEARSSEISTRPRSLATFAGRDLYSS